MLSDFVDHNAVYLYPALAVVVFLLMTGGILQAWKSNELAGLERAEFKREIVIELRRQVTGATAEAIARHFKLELFQTVSILEEMQRDGLLTSHTRTDRQTFWAIKGLPGVRRGT